MIRRLPVNELGQRRPSFTHPDVPPPVAVGKCPKCGGGTRAEDYTSYTKEHGLRNMRTYRCIQHGTRCPSDTVVVGEDNQEAIVAKNKAGSTPCIQTREWCDAQKAAIVKKHLAYRDVAKAAAVSASALAQGLNMHMSLSEETQARIEQVIAQADPVQAEKTRKERASRKPKAVKLPASLQGPPSERVSEWAAQMAKETQERVMSNIKAQEALPPDATVKWSEEPPKPGLTHELDAPMPGEDGNLVIVDVETGNTHNVTLGGPYPAAPSEYVLLDRLNQRHLALEHRVQEMAEQTEARFTRMDQEQLELQTEREFLDADTARRFQEMEDRITETYNHLSEHMANLQPLVVNNYVEETPEELTLPPTWGQVLITPDLLVQHLSGYTDVQLAAMVAAAAARRELHKSLEAA